MEEMRRPTLEQEYEELAAIQKLLLDYDTKALEYHRLANSLRLMLHTIKNSIEKRKAVDAAWNTAAKETHPTLSGAHKSELEELKNAKKSG